MNIPLKISKKTKKQRRMQKTKQDNANNMYMSVKVNRNFAWYAFFFMLDILTIRNSFISVNITVSHY